jgi:hypothetical protein
LASPAVATGPAQPHVNARNTTTDARVIVIATAPSERADRPANLVASLSPRPSGEQGRKRLSTPSSSAHRRVPASKPPIAVNLALAAVAVGARTDRRFPP